MRGKVEAAGITLELRNTPHMRRLFEYIGFLSILALRRDGGPDTKTLEQVFDELQDWEHQLKHADIDWDALDVDLEL